MAEAAAGTTSSSDLQALMATLSKMQAGQQTLLEGFQDMKATLQTVDHSLKTLTGKTAHLEQQSQRHSDQLEELTTRVTALEQRPLQDNMALDAPSPLDFQAQLLLALQAPAVIQHLQQQSPAPPPPSHLTQENIERTIAQQVQQQTKHVPALMATVEKLASQACTQPAPAHKSAAAHTWAQLERHGSDVAAQQAIQEARLAVEISGNVYGFVAGQGRADPMAVPPPSAQVARSKTARTDLRANILPAFFSHMRVDVEWGLIAEVQYVVSGPSATGVRIICSNAKYAKDLRFSLMSAFRAAEQALAALCPPGADESEKKKRQFWARDALTAEEWAIKRSRLATHDMLRALNVYAKVFMDRSALMVVPVGARAPRPYSGEHKWLHLDQYAAPVNPDALKDSHPPIRWPAHRGEPAYYRCTSDA
jgi:hypothetical protein